METISIKEYVALRKKALREQIVSLKKPPVLSIIRVGNDPASEAYVRGKLKDANEVGIKALLFPFPEDIDETTLCEVVISQSNDPSIDGIIVQLPLPKHIDAKKVVRLLSPSKDVDGFSPYSPCFPCTPKGIVDYLSATGLSFRGKNAVVFGRSEIVGKPMAKLLLKQDCNVTVLHSKTSEEDRRFYCSHADLIAAAVGKQFLLDDTYSFKKDCVLVDVGINRGSDGHLHGDILPDRDVVLQTPVPGGVGLLTRLALLENLMEVTRK